MQNDNPRNQIYISAVTTAFNEEDNLPQLVKEVHETCLKIGRKWEMVITDDGSTDSTPDVLKKLMGQYPQLRVISMKSRSGQSAGLEAAIRAARGELIATMDADLQNDPAEIPRLLKMMEEGNWDMVNGWRKDRNDPFIRLLSTKIANGTRNFLTKENIKDTGCGLKLIKAKCLEKIRFYNGIHRFLPTLVKMEGYKVTEVPVTHRPRTAGKAKYGVWNRVFRALRDTFAIRWMQSRIVLYQASEVERE